MPPRTWALGFGAFSSLFFRPVSNGSGQVFVNVRHYDEFESFIRLPQPLLANFCILTDPFSKQVSSELKDIVNQGAKLNCTDVEMDEPDVQEVVQRYAISSVPTVLAFRGGYEFSRHIPRNTPDWQQDLRNWVQSLEK